MKRKGFSVHISAKKPWALALSIVLLLAFCSSAGSQPARLNVSYSSESPGSLPVWIAKDSGLYAKNGLDVQLLRVTGNVAVMALVSGEVNVGLMGGSAAITSNLGGSDAVMVAAGQVSTDYSLVTNPKVKTAQQLKGGIVGVASIVGSSMTATLYALQKLGLNTKDVNVLLAGGTPERLAALKSGRIQATILSPPTSFVAEKEGYNVLLDVIVMPLPYNSIVSTRRFVRENPDSARRFIKAHLEAVNLLKTDRETGIKTLAKYLRRTRDRPLLEKSYDISVSDTIMPRKQYPTLAGIKSISDFLVKTYPKAATARPRISRKSALSRNSTTTDLLTVSIGSRNERMKFLSLALAALCIVAGFAGKTAVAADTVKISISNVEGSFLFGAVAAKKGFFAEENLNAELIRIAGNVMVPAMANGDIDYTLMFGSVVRATLSSFPFKVAGSFVDSPTGALVGKATVTTPQSLKGKSIAVSSFGAGAYVTAVLTVQHLGMSPNEVKLVASGGDAGRLAALQNGLVDAALLNPAAAARAERLGFRVIARSYELFTFPYAGLGTTNRKLAEKPAEVKRVLRALIKGSRFMRENRDETVQVLSDWAGIDRQSAADYYDATWRSSSPDGSIPEKGLRLVIEDAKSALKIQRDVSFAEVADDSLVKEVQRDMKIKGR